MKLLSLFTLSAAAAGWVVPPDQKALRLEQPSETGANRLSAESEGIVPSSTNGVNTLRNELHESYDRDLSDFPTTVPEDFFDAKAWLSSHSNDFNERSDNTDADDGHEHHRPGHGHHGHHKANLTVYQLIASSNYTTILAKLVNEYNDLVDFLNSTAVGTNVTVFAPTDRAFRKIPDDAPKPSKELLKRVLSYHISPDFYPAGRVLVSHTIPTLLEGTFLSESPADTPQRLSTNIGLKGLTVNFYSRVVAIDIFGTNGVIHGVDSILIPPPKAAAIIQLLPSEFSTLELGLLKTGLLPVINDTSSHLGGTLFAPSNFAFQKLGPRANAFLFSKYGQKYLEALLKYHIVANQTLYSDAFYKPERAGTARIPKGLFHVDLPTLLNDKHLSIDIFRYGRYINIKINGFASVTVSDGIAKDGVIHALSNVLIPPKQINGQSIDWQGEELDEEDLKARLTPFMEHSFKHIEDL